MKISCEYIKTQLYSYFILFALVIFALCFSSCNSCNKKQIEKGKIDFSFDIVTRDVDFLQKKSVAKNLEKFKSSLKNAESDINLFMATAEAARTNDNISFLVPAMLTEYALALFADNKTYCDSAFLAISSLLEGDLPGGCENFMEQNCSYNYDAEENDDDKLTIILNNIKDCGYRAICSEGSFQFMIADVEYLNEKFSNLISPFLADYLAELAKYPDGIISDAALLISYDDLWSLILKLEKVAEVYPYKQIFSTEFTEDTLLIYMYILLFGIDNSPVYDYSTQIILPEIQDLYKRVAQSEDKTPMQQVIEKYYTALVATDFIYNTNLIFESLPEHLILPEHEHANFANYIDIENKSLN